MRRLFFRLAAEVPVVGAFCLVGLLTGCTPAGRSGAGGPGNGGSVAGGGGGGNGGGGGAGGNGGVPGETRYPLSGEIVSADVPHHTLTVRHNAIEGYMPAMTMDFPVSPGDAAAGRAGERIRAELVVDARGNVRLEKIWPDDKVAVDTIDAGRKVLREDTNDRGAGAYREVGENIPTFALFDQSGKVFSSGRFRGRQIMLNFIYTRCPIANMCPAATLKMMATQRQSKAAGVDNVEFVSITLDPTYDTPGVLREYADVRGIDLSNYTFLTGPEAAIKDLLTQFGVIAEFDGDILKHSLATLLIDENGRITYRADGSQWEPADFVRRMHRRK